MPNRSHLQIIYPPSPSMTPITPAKNHDECKCFINLTLNRSIESKRMAKTLMTFQSQKFTKRALCSQSNLYARINYWATSSACRVQAPLSLARDQIWRLDLSSQVPSNLVAKICSKWELRWTTSTRLVGMRWMSLRKLRKTTLTLNTSIACKWLP